jgi:glc operon protein GlcG
MFNKPVLQHFDVTRIMAAAVQEANKNQWAVAIAVVDDGGHLLGLTRLDGLAPIAVHMCQEKARAAALGRRDSKVYEDIINNGRISFLSAPLLQGLIEGGVPIMVDGHVVGAVGVSGVKSPEDAQVAQAGAAAVATA